MITYVPDGEDITLDRILYVFDHTKQVKTTKESYSPYYDATLVEKGNPYHEPAGTSTGGQFAHSPITTSQHYGDERKDGKVSQNILSGWDGDRYSVASMGLYNYNQGIGELDVIKDGGEVVGVACLGVYAYPVKGTPMGSGDYTELGYMATKRSGYGRASMKHAAESARKRNAGIYLKAVPSAVGFYEAIGMHKMDGVERGYYWTYKELEHLFESVIKEPTNGVFVNGFIATKESYSSYYDIALTEKGNPYHEPAGSPDGGQFAHGPGTAKTLAEAEQWVKDNTGADCKYRGISVDDANTMNTVLADELSRGRFPITSIVSGAPKTVLMNVDFNNNLKYNAKNITERTDHKPEGWESEIQRYEVAIGSLRKQYDSVPETDHRFRMQIANQMAKYTSVVDSIKDRVKYGEEYVPFSVSSTKATRKESLESTMRHEIAHMRFNNISGRDKGEIALWYQSRGTVFPTQYSRKLKEEWFAESFALYRDGKHNKIDKRLLEYFRGNYK